MAKKAGLSFGRTARDGGVIRLDGAVVAEVRRLELVNFRPRRDAEPLVGEDVGVPLYWRQYGNHQDPERSANSRRRLTVVEIGARHLMLQAEGETRSGAMHSRFEVVLRVDARGAIRVEVRARLEIARGAGWLVTPHPDHGEVTFLTLWPRGVFSPDGSEPKRFQCCLLERGGRVERVEHHHLESPDKHHLRLRAGDRFAWTLEDVNPVVTLGAGTRAEAGVCAYMWDTHFGVRICRERKPVVLPAGTVLTASYTLEAKSRRQLAPLVRCARLRPAGAALDTPVYRGARHTFAETFRSAGIDRNTAWPWQREVVRGVAQLARDTRIGWDDRFSLRISAKMPALARWQATTLGPAFGEPAFRRGVRLKLSARVKTADLVGAARIAVRVHRRGCGSVFAAESYGMFANAVSTGERGGWSELLAVTPPLRPEPDRVHLLLELDGAGTAWFDDVRLEQL